MIIRNRGGTGFDNAPDVCLLFARSVDEHGEPRKEISYFYSGPLVGMDPLTSVPLPNTKI